MRQFESLRHGRVIPVRDVTYRKIHAYAASFRNVGKNSQPVETVVWSSSHISARESQLLSTKQFTATIQWRMENPRIVSVS
ncbi:MAG: hypothetical protein ABGZ53_16190 [Fuerstiella sp.]